MMTNLRWSPKPGISPDWLPAIWGLYAITPDCPDTADLLRRTRCILAGGARVLQYRNKAGDARLHLTQATALRELTLEFGATFILNDDACLARQVGADGVHLGAADGELKEARAILGDHKIIGISCYNQFNLVRDAVAVGADYVALGAFFPSKVKPDAVAADIDLLRRVRAEFAVSLVAIGGITHRNAAVLAEAGADAVAVISAVYDAVDNRSAARDFANFFIREHAS